MLSQKGAISSNPLAKSCLFGRVNRMIPSSIQGIHILKENFHFPTGARSSQKSISPLDLNISLCAQVFFSNRGIDDIEMAINSLDSHKLGFFADFAQVIDNVIDGKYRYRVHYECTEVDVIIGRQFFTSNQQATSF